MKGKNLVLAELLSIAIKNSELQLDKNSIRSIDWDDIYNEACIYNIHTLLYSVMKKISHEFKPDEKVMTLWNIAMMSCGIKMTFEELKLSEVIAALNSSRIKTIVVKGIAINKCYFIPEMLEMRSTHIFIDNKDVTYATEVLNSLGYTAEKNDKTRNITFNKKNSISFKINRLSEPYDFLVNKERFLSKVWEKPIEVELGMTKANVISLEMQVLIICIHMVISMRNGGIQLRQLCDLLIITEEKREQINWDIVKSEAEQYGILQFVYAIYQTCNQLLKTDIPEAIDCKHTVCNENVNRLIEDIFQNSDYHDEEKDKSSTKLFLKNLYNSGSLEFKIKLMEMFHLLILIRKLMLHKINMIFKKRTSNISFKKLYRKLNSLAREDLSHKDSSGDITDDTANEKNNLLEWLGIR